MTFRDPLWLVALLLPGLLILAWRVIRCASVRFPTGEGLQTLERAGHPGWLYGPRLLRLAALLLIVFALARPQDGLESSRMQTSGIDIILAVDVSTSMLAEDFQLHGTRRNRLEVVKAVVAEFVEHRPNDRIGLVVFAGRPYTQCPLTLDHGWLLSQLERVEIGMVEDGTAIGSGIATGLNRLRHSTAKSRMMVLLTDGVNNAGEVSPEAAAQLARALDVKIYTIGAGTRGEAPYPTTDLFGRKAYQRVRIEVDDEGLGRIAEMSGGLSFRATDTESLQRVYEQIDRMETTTIEQPQYLSYKEGYPGYVILAMLLILLEVALSETWLRVLP